MPRSRQLAAIMFTDIQGYTALMQQDEAQALRVRDKHRRIFNTSTEKYRGRILQYYGDGTLSIFDSAIDAVRCAVEMQLGFREAPVIPVRIGIHTGEVIFSEEEIIGDSVNVASRIESLAVPGSVFISDKVYDEIKNQVAIQTVRLRAFQLKNVARPIEVYAIANAGLIVPPPEEISGKTEPAQPSTPPSPQPSDRQAPPPFLLTTKLYAPPPRSKAVHRPRLTTRLDAGLTGKLSLLSAPAGFGKTTLVSEWAAATGRPVAWLSLDESDSDLHRFLTYFIAALQTIAPAAGEQTLSLLQAPQPPPTEAVLTALLNEIAAIREPSILILDDYHVIDARPVDQALAFLLDHLPPVLHLAITTREDPNLPLARLRVRGRLTELRAADLRFTPAEAAGFLNEVMDLNLSEKDVAVLEKRTEGWIAGLQLAALSMQGRTDSDSFIQAFAGSHHFILDYLMEEVLQRQSEDIRRFLLQTSILERLCGDLCDAVTGQADSREVLETLERSNLFVLPLDDRRRWYRYHHLFADVLRARAGEEQPDQLPALHRRASLWFGANDLPAEAIRHALAGSDYERAGALIERVWPDMDGSFQSPTWLKWLQALPEGMVRHRPVLLVGHAWSLLNEGILEAGEVKLREAEELLKGPREEMVIVDEEQFRFLPGSIATARAYWAQGLGDIPGTVHYARQALDLLLPDDYLRRGPAAALLGLAYWSAGDLEAAHQALTDSMEGFRKGGSLLFALSGTYGLADIRLAQGRLREAMRTYERALREATDRDGPVLRGTGDLYLGIGDLHREQGDLKKAEQNLQRSEALGEAAALPDWPYRRRLARARLCVANSDLEGALEFLDQAEQVHYRSPVPEARPLEAIRAQIWLRQGRWPEVQSWIQEKGLSVDDAFSYLTVFEHLTLARMLIARYRRDREEESMQKAAGLLERLLETAEAGGWTGTLLEILIVQAIAAEAREETAQALPPLERALALAEPEGYVRLFADEGPPMARLLVAAATRGLYPEYTGKLLAAIPQQSAEKQQPAPAPHLQPLVEPLSERELEILRLIAQGLSNREISERLFLALSTVKGHNQNIFGKLEVQRRTEAVARARELGLL